MSGQDRLTAAQERSAVIRIGENIALRSGAGCGKTSVLARRFTELLMRYGKEGNVLSRFVALTFTEKAAMEMSQRLRRFLGERAAAAKGESRRKLLGWIEELPDARISTIHGFCASILRSRAVEAGLDPDFSVCGDEALTGGMISTAAEDAILSAVEQGRSDALALVAETSLDEVAKWVAGLVELRASCELAEYTDPAAIVARWELRLKSERSDAWRRLSQDKEIPSLLAEVSAAPCQDDGNDKLAEYRRVQLDVVARLLSDPAWRRPENFALLSEKPRNRGSVNGWGGKEAIQAVRTTMKELNASLLEYAPYTEDLGPADSQAAEGLAGLVRLAGEANSRYASQKRQRGILDFTDLLERCDALLKDRPAIRRALGSDIDQLLIDECQDTDAFQVAMLERLLFGRANPQDLPQGRLFLVGDPKQSIYRFRGAQVEVFDDLCRRLGPNKQESLQLSFRTHPAGAAFVNHLFAPLMGQDYEPIQAAREQCPPQEAVEVLLASGGKEPIDSAEDSIRLQAAVTARRIRQLIDAKDNRVWDASKEIYRPVAPGDVAILLGRMPVSPVFERELTRWDIPWYVVAGSGFLRQQEVMDILNALRVVENPFDDVSLIGVLRSSLFGLDDESLLRISLARRPPYWPGLDDAADALPPTTAKTLRFACRLLVSLHRRKDAVGIDALIDRFLIETGYEATLLSQPQGRRALGNIRMLLDRARSAAAEGVALANFIAQMDELTINEARYEQAAVAGEADNVVRLMTIHKAKGLEFPVVFLPDLNFCPKGRSSRLMLRSDWGLVYKPASDSDENDEPSEDETDQEEAGDGPLSWRLAASREKRDEKKEDIRKLYVAATRARDFLVFVAADWRGKDGAFKKGDCHIRRIDSVLGISQAVGDGRDSIPYDGGRYSTALRVVEPSAPPNRPKRPAGEKLLAEATTPQELAEGMARLGRPTEPPPLLADLPESTWRIELPVTAMNEFAACPMRYRWQYELRLVPPTNRSRPSTGPIDAATAGTIFHRCMELLDFAHPQSPEELFQRAIREMGLTDKVAPDKPAAEFADMLGKLQSQPLWEAMVSARQKLRELDFVLAVGGDALRGKIDLLFEDARGRWTLVDYKSDRLSTQGPAEHARRYELQVLTYALAAGRFLGHHPDEGILLFLRTGQAVRIPTTTSALEAAQVRLEGLLAELRTARRTGRFVATASRCPSCPYGPLCDGKS